MVLLLAALGLVLYPSASQWWNSLLHARELNKLSQVVAIGPEARLEAIRANAQDFNDRLYAGLDTSDYLEQLDPNYDSVMGRILIPKIGVDLPIFHTSSDEVLLRGAGHLENTGLPIGGIGNHPAITAHRGLATSKLFTDLDKIDVGDRFTLEVLGEPLVYEVFDTRIVKPTETEWLKVDPEKDLVTLITCDPLGINTERMLVTGERVSPTPQNAIDEVGASSDQPGFPYFLVYLGLGMISVGSFSYWYFFRVPKSK